MTNTATAPLAPHGFGSLADLSDDELLASTRRIVGRSNQLLAALLAHLGEVEARGIYRVRSCASVYTYCIYELRMSEDAAFRRARAAKIARQYPVVLDRIAAGEIHLTALLMLGPHLTEENHLNVLERAKHRTKMGIARLVRMLDPLPDVASVVQPLGPARSPLAIRTNPTWGGMMAALQGPVRELESGDRPSDWIDPDADADLLAEDTPAEPCAEQPPPMARGAADATNLKRNARSVQSATRCNSRRHRSMSTCSRRREISWRTPSRAARSNRCTSCDAPPGRRTKEAQVCREG